MKLEIGWLANIQTLQNNTQFECPVVSNDRRSAWAQYTLLCKDRIEMQIFSANDIPTAVHYPMALNLQPAVLDDTLKLLNVKCCLSVLSLPMHAYMDKQTSTKIIDLLTS